MSHFSKILIFLIALCTLSSCGTSALIPRSELNEISQALNIDVTRGDNLDLLKASADWIGVRYRYGGNSKSGVDCSALTCDIIKSSYNITLSRKASDIFDKNCREIAKFSLRPGDLVFFNFGNRNKWRQPIDHVGIYLKDDVFIHASLTKGVTTNRLTEKYYKDGLLYCGRIKR